MTRKYFHIVYEAMEANENLPREEWHPVLRVMFDEPSAPVNRNRRCFNVELAGPCTLSLNGLGGSPLEYSGDKLPIPPRIGLYTDGPIKIDGGEWIDD